jgi:hypothetical protein
MACTGFLQCFAGALTTIGLLIAGSLGEAQAAKRSFTIAAVEPKSGTTVDKEPFPQGKAVTS